MSNSKNIPLVSVVIPAFNDSEYIDRALRTATSQSLKNIEIICVDDSSTDNTVAVIETYTKMDPRVKLVRHKENASAFQARLTGILAAQSDYILFLDGDDELHKDAAKLSYTQALGSKSDIVGFGSKIVRKDGSSPREFEKSVQPTHRELAGPHIVATLFKPNTPAQGSLWRFLFSKKLLLKAYGYFEKSQRIDRSNDLPITFLCASFAKKYTSLSDKLYIYHYYAGGSSSSSFTIDRFKFYTRAIDSVNLLKTVIENGDFNDTVKDSYYSARLFVISNIIRQIEQNLPVKYHREAIDLLITKVGLSGITASIACFIPEALDTLRTHLPHTKQTGKTKNIALFTNNLNTGGVQGVVISQAKYLRDAGFNVTIILLNDGNIAFTIPDGVKVEFLQKGPINIRLRSFEDVLASNKIDTVIDHNILYNFSWPFFSLMAKSLGVKTLAWTHSFALRPLTEGKTNGKFLHDNITLIDDLVVLSKPDVSYWKSLGHKNVYYLPNPPSPLLLENTEKIQTKSTPKEHLNIIWYGRLQQATKKVYSLVDVASELKKLTDTFTLTIIGPDGNDLKASDVKERVKTRNLQANVKVTGPKHGNELIKELKNADVYLSTSIIEGYPLTIFEAQSYALPVVMYELPWLAANENNHGIVQTPQSKPALAAQEIYSLFNDKKLYGEMSKASLDASRRYLSYDFSKLYSDLLNHSLPEEFSPNINSKHMGMFAEWTQIFFAELAQNGELAGGLELVKNKDAHIMALKNSKAMKIGTTVIKPAQMIKGATRKAAKRLKKSK